MLGKPAEGGISFIFIFLFTFRVPLMGWGGGGGWSWGWSFSYYGIFGWGRAVFLYHIIIIPFLFFSRIRVSVLGYLVFHL